MVVLVKNGYRYTMLKNGTMSWHVAMINYGKMLKHGNMSGHGAMINYGKMLKHGYLILLLWGKYQSLSLD